MPRFDYEHKKVTTDWLTSVLGTNGFLLHGEVSSVQQDVVFSENSLVSDFLSLTVEYSRGSRGRRPPKIIMKLLRPDFNKEREIFFYDVLVQRELEFSQFMLSD